MSTVTELQVTGMTCAHCETAVTGALSALPGVTSVHIGKWTDGVTRVSVTGENEIGRAEATSALHEAGYGLAEA